MNNFFKIFLICSISIFIFNVFIFVAAAKQVEFKPQITIPVSGTHFTKGVTTTVPVGSNLLGLYISDLYHFSIGLAGILAVLMIAYGGVVWTFSGGESSKISHAKEIIIGAVTGLVLALGSYLILNTINPKLTILSLDSLRPLDPAVLKLSRFNLPFCPSSKLTEICGGLNNEDGCYYTHSGAYNICFVQSTVAAINDVKKDNVDFDVRAEGDINRPIEINKGFIGKGSFQEIQNFVVNIDYQCGDIIIDRPRHDNYQIGSKCNGLDHCVIYALTENGNPGLGGNSILKEKETEGYIFGEFKYHDCYES